MKSGKKVPFNTLVWCAGIKPIEFVKNHVDEAYRDAGDYSELHSHLTNSTEHMSEGADAALANAEAMKEQVGDPVTHSFPPSHSSTPARGDP